jgi:hypothetical protein
LAAEGEYNALARVREHLDDAHAAADRLVQEAHRRAEEAARAAAADVPPCGWEAPRDERGRGLPDVSPLLALLDAVRGRSRRSSRASSRRRCGSCCSRCAR